MKSQNGWDVVPSSGRLVPLKWVTGRVRGGDVHFLFDHFCHRFNREVEPIRRDHSWGWAYRPIRGKSSGFSNHSSGTAIDLNAPAHPLGKRGTFSDKQAKAIRKILADLDGVLRWGGDYSGRPDEMHFEINTGWNEVHDLVHRLKKPETQEEEMNAEQERKLDKALDASQRAVIRGNVNTRLMQRIAKELKIDIKDLADEIEACDKAEK